MSETIVAVARKAIALGTTWLTSHQLAAGSFADGGDELVSTYKAPLAFALAGQTEAGVKCLQYIKTHNLNGDGELASGDGSHKTGFASNQRNFANYMDGWVAIGAWLLGDYGFAARLSTRLLPQQAAHGGFPTGPEKWSGKTRYDILTNASIGRAMLLAGLPTAADKVADFLVQVVAPAHQAHLPQAFDMSFDANWNPVVPDDPADRRYYQFLYGTRGERVFCPAFACAFLCEMAALRGRNDLLTAARHYLDVILQTPEFRDASLSNGKSGWASGLLALAGDDGARAAALQIMPNMLARQRPDGEFAAAGDGEVPWAKRLEATAEHVAWAREYLRLATLGL